MLLAQHSTNSSPFIQDDVSRTVVLRGVSKSYRRGNSRTNVLNTIDLKIHRGECVFLLGPSGSGKTTLLSIIGCVLTPDSGNVEVLGRNLSGLKPRDMAQLRRDEIGFVFQRIHLIRGLTALENVCLPLTLAGWGQGVAKLRADELLEQVGLADRATSNPNAMSVGQCQRIALARALAADPALVLADEPTASLDADAGRNAMQMLRRLTVEAGKTLVVVTHDQRILPYADRVLTVEKGELREHAGWAVALNYEPPTLLPPLPPREGRTVPIEELTHSTIAAPA